MLAQFGRRMPHTAHPVVSGSSVGESSIQSSHRVSEQLSPLRRPLPCFYRFIFVLLWTTFVYDPVVFWVWNYEGWLYRYGVIDYAGALVRGH